MRTNERKRSIERESSPTSPSVPLCRPASRHPSSSSTIVWTLGRDDVAHVVSSFRGWRRARNGRMFASSEEVLTYHLAVRAREAC